jgi:hypothetical protein
MTKSRQGAEPDDLPRHEGRNSKTPIGARLVSELVISGLGLIFPALAFMAAAFAFYAPAGRAIAPFAVGLTFVGLALVLVGCVLRRDSSGSGRDP